MKKLLLKYLTKVENLVSGIRHLKNPAILWCSQFSTCRPDLLVLARGTNAEARIQHSMLIAADCPRRLFGRLGDDLHASFQRLRLFCKPRPLLKQHGVRN